MHSNNFLPTVKLYTNLLNKAVTRFKISHSEARKRYGHYTVNKWNQLFNQS
jgi:hypothetical protein